MEDQVFSAAISQFMKVIKAEVAKTVREEMAAQISKNASILATPIPPGIKPHLSEQPESPGLPNISNLGYDDCATDTDSEKETLHKVFDIFCGPALASTTP
ncbi:MAG: hypothetical protein J3R72DRAFT_417012 [Linnemannia gamsii]|nr:MAG: hypothetical protein J3R72DRAFT_428657 [Linnemannia gamsii]KAK3805412.1 MAG: hypothetical protein J3R72DRAFT_428654 [Linnemannia gamsii]KAK3847184.1 MAG: hypothetical protein J3R72DRAFT_417012 [Linnemannia gamsii]